MQRTPKGRLSMKLSFCSQFFPSFYKSNLGGAWWISARSTASGGEVALPHPPSRREPYFKSPRGVRRRRRQKGGGQDIKMDNLQETFGPPFSVREGGGLRPPRGDQGSHGGHVLLRRTVALGDQGSHGSFRETKGLLRDYTRYVGRARSSPHQKK